MSGLAQGSEGRRLARQRVGLRTGEPLISAAESMPEQQEKLEHSHTD